MRTIILVLAAFFLLSCDEGEHSDLRQWMNDASKDIRGRISPLPEVKPYEPVPYDAGSLVDPFRPSKIGVEQKKGGGGLQPNMDRPREPLESYPLETLRYVGVMTKKNSSYAIIQVEGALYQVRTGNYLGQNFGVITKISETEVTLKELVQDSAGDWVEKVSTLLLQGPEEKK